MSRDSLDELTAKLLQAAREEPLPKAAVERAIAAAAEARLLRQTGPHRRLATLGLSLAIAAGVALALWRARAPDDPGASIAAEPTQALPAPKNQHAAPRAVPSAPTSAISAPSTAPTPLRAPPPALVPSHAPAGASLADELDALKRAETALGSGDSRGALDALDRYEHVLHGEKLRAEAALLRMDALSRSGHAEQAAALAARFVADNPGSPLVDRARSFLTKSAAPGGSGTPAPGSSASPAGAGIP
jgi:hypothetical protein